MEILKNNNEIKIIRYNWLKKWSVFYFLYLFDKSKYDSYKKKLNSDWFSITKVYNLKYSIKFVYKRNIWIVKTKYYNNYTLVWRKEAYKLWLI